MSYGGFNLEIDEIGCKEQYRVEVSNMFATLEDMDVGVNINSVWETIREDIKMSAEESIDYCELKKHKAWFDEGYIAR
jgi:hypothetical protein